MPKALILYADGRREVKDLSKTKDYQREVGGYIELLPNNKDGYVNPLLENRREFLSCYVNEEGRLAGLSANPYTSVLSLLGVECGLVLGNIIVMKEGDKNDKSVEQYIVDLFKKYDKYDDEDQFYQMVMKEQGL